MTHDALPPDWPFDQAPNVAAFTLRRIVFADAKGHRKPVLYVKHDEDDHAWQFLDGDSCTVEDAAIVCMREVLGGDPTLATIADLPAGWAATREHVGGPWHRFPTTADVPDAEE